jgi:transposase-like protein
VAAALGVLFVVVMPSTVGWFVWQGLPPQKDVTVFASTFGDIVGPLFAALAFAGLIYTALMQREELSLQREELRETREELKRSADAQKEQVNVAQMAARLNATSALLDSASQELASFGMSSEGGQKRIARENVAQFRAELETQRKELSRTIEGSASFSGIATLTANGEVKRKDA